MSWLLSPPASRLGWYGWIDRDSSDETVKGGSVTKTKDTYGTKLDFHHMYSTALFNPITPQKQPSAENVNATQVGVANHGNRSSTNNARGDPFALETHLTAAVLQFDWAVDMIGCGCFC